MFIYKKDKIEKLDRKDEKQLILTLTLRLQLVAIELLGISGGC